MNERLVPFLSGDGEMEQLTRDFDWAQTALGAIEAWPLSLRVQVSMMLRSRFPMLIFWGPDLVTFYNDAFRPSLGEDGKHPSSLGQKGEQSRAESWPVIGPMIHDIMAGGNAVWFEDQKLPLYRDGKMGYAYWTYSFSPLADDAGAVNGVLVTCSETTKAVEGLAQLQQAGQRLDNLFAQMNAGLSQTDTDGRFVAVNDRYCHMVGYSRQELLGMNMADVDHPDDRSAGAEQLRACIEQGSDFLIRKRYIRKDGAVIWVSNSVSCVSEPDGRKLLTAVSIDVSNEKEQERLLLESKAHLALLRDAVPAMTFYLDAEQRYQSYNQVFMEWFGVSKTEAIGKTVRGFVGDAAYGKIKPYLDAAYAGEQVRYELLAPSRMGGNRWLSIVYTPHKEDDGSVKGIVVHATDISESKQTEMALRESESRFQSLVRDASVGLIVLMGSDMRVAVVNEAYCKLIGHSVEETLRRPLFDVIPEAAAYFMPILAEVMSTGAPFVQNEVPYKVHSAAGEAIEGFADLTYQPFREADGSITGIMAVINDVTERVIARRQLEDNETRLRTAIELAELANWTVDLEDNKVRYSDRFREWLGVSENEFRMEGSPNVHEADRARIAAALKKATGPGSDGAFNEVYSIIHRRTGHQRIIHAIGNVFFNESGKAIAISGTAQDVTMQKELQLALQNEVQTRTEELAVTVEELRTTNEELEESNEQLIHSNEELAQYAYVASHDLQEPLRKIRVFTGMLGSNEDLPLASRPMLEKISSSAERMSLLIQDLLSFSRLLKSDTLMRPVSLQETVAAVWTDFELVVAEKEATIEMGQLPEIEAVNLQMNQLFYNLISNALKFTATGRRPKITVLCHLISQADVRKYISKPLAFSNYYHITVSDNGIGFETQYHEQIFEVFKRLHGRELYPGSGIGLALCRRIVANHHGYLYAASEEGQGSTFHIILPDRQHDATSTFSDQASLGFTHMD